MIVYRLSKEKFKDDLAGKGAKEAGARWNSKGRPMLYTSESRALCTTEIAVHTTLGNIPTDYYITTIEIPDTAEICELKDVDLPRDWKAFPHPNATQRIGDQFLSDGEYLAMKVPSVVVQGDSNFLLNPLHKLFAQVKIIESKPFEFDDRLFLK